jgi:hypothetical protein
VSSVLVEGQKYAYLYGQPPPQQQHGQQQVRPSDGSVVFDVHRLLRLLRWDAANRVDA